MIVKSVYRKTERYSFFQTIYTDYKLFGFILIYRSKVELK